MIKRTCIFIVLMTGSIIYGANTQCQISTPEGLHVTTIEGAIQYAKDTPMNSNSLEIQTAQELYTQDGFINLARNDILKDFCMRRISKEYMYGAYLALQKFCGLEGDSLPTTAIHLLNEGFMQRNMLNLSEIFSNR